MIDIGQIIYDRPLAIIYNPSAGKRIDMKAKIAQKLDQYGIKYEFLETQGFLDAYRFVKNLKIDDFSAVVAVGGDGTCHEVVNGLLRREDKRKIPVGFLPNGTGNDLCGALSYDNID